METTSIGGRSGGGAKPKPADTCPECGVDMSTTTPEKHSIYHWGDMPLPVNHLTLGARKKQAAILGEPEPER